MNKNVLALFCLVVLVTAGCASRWSLRSEGSEVPLQWPSQPNKAKIAYVKAIKGFSLKNDSRALLRAIVYGSEEGDQDAFNLPVAVARGRDGRIAVADLGCRCVHLYIPEQQRYLRITSTGPEEFNSPVSVIFDDDLRLYVSDSALGKVFVFGSDGAFISALQGAGASVLKRPTGLAYNSHLKILYVVDTIENKVYAFDSGGKVAFSFGSWGEGKGQFNFPTHVFWSPQGTVYVTDSMNFRIQFFDESGAYLGSFGHQGDGSGDLARPKGVAVDKEGIIYVVDSLFDNVQLFSKQGEFLLTVGRTGSDFGEFWLPSGIFIDDSDTIYVCDSYNRRVQVFRKTGDNTDGKP